MAESLIQTSYVAEVVEGSQANLTGSVEALVGQEITVGSARLIIGERVADGFLGTACFTGRLRTGSLLVPTVTVEICVSPWSTTRSEVGIRPLSRLGALTGLRTQKFVAAAYAVLANLSDRMTTVEDASALPVLQVAA